MTPMHTGLILSCVNLPRTCTCPPTQPNVHNPSCPHAMHLCTTPTQHKLHLTKNMLCSASLLHPYQLSTHAGSLPVMHKIPIPTLYIVTQPTCWLLQLLIPPAITICFNRRITLTLMSHPLQPSSATPNSFHLTMASSKY